jgi:hypothetical protein
VLLCGVVWCGVLCCVVLCCVVLCCVVLCCVLYVLQDTCSCAALLWCAVCVTGHMFMCYSIVVCCMLQDTCSCAALSWCVVCVIGHMFMCRTVMVCCMCCRTHVRVLHYRGVLNTMTIIMNRQCLCDKRSATPTSLKNPVNF